MDYNSEKLKNVENSIIEFPFTSHLTMQSLLTVINHISDFILLVDQNGRITYVNPAFEKFSGLQPNDIIGKELNSLQPLYSDANYLNKVWSTIADHLGKLRDKIDNVDDTALTSVNISFNKLHDPQTNQTHYLYIGQDITKRIELEKALLESEQSFNLALEGSELGLWDWDLTTNLVVFNQRWCDMVHYTRAEIEGDYKNWENLIYPDDIISIKKALSDHFDLKSQYFRTEYRIRTREGKWRWVFNHGKVVARDATGKPTRIIGTQRDITERKETEEALRQSEQRLTLHVHQTPLAYIEWNPALEVLDWNPAAEKIFGFTKAEALGKHATDLIVPKAGKNPSSVWKGIIKTTGGSTNDNITKDGRLLICEWYNTPLVNSQGQVSGLASLVQDITEHKKATEALEKRTKELEILNQKLIESEKELRQLNVNKDAFISIIAHDLKGPFTGLIGLSGILKEEMQEVGNDMLLKIADDVYKSTKKTYRFLEELLELSIIQRGIQDFVPEYIQIISIIQSVFELYKENAKQKNITLNFTGDENTIAYADKSMVETVVRNLLANAIKFTPRGGTINIITQMSDMVKISVKDSGVGISDAGLKKMFRIDEKHRTVGSDGEKGTGLGLILCKELVEKNGGTIWAQSEPGNGAEFIFTLPIKG